MSEFHYVRTLGVDGGVDACDGPAIGLDLETVLEDGLPPWNVALEVVAALCEVLDIAEEDSEVHGGLHPKYVFIDETGAVSLEGFGVPRNKTRAPEGTPKGPVTDLYGLGYTAFRAICLADLPENMPDDDPDRHDDLVIDKILEVELDGLPEEMQGDIQWFIAKLMSFDREDRPRALEAWRTFIAFASEVDGPDMASWCAAALDGGGERRDAAQQSANLSASLAGHTSDEEDLDGPMMGDGPLEVRPAINFDDAPSSNKGATAFWTKEDMKRALERPPEEEGPPMGHGGGEATSFWSRDQMEAMAAGESGAPRPRRAEGQGERRRATAQNRAPGADSSLQDVGLNTPPPKSHDRPTVLLDEPSLGPPADVPRTTAGTISPSLTPLPAPVQQRSPRAPTPPPTPSAAHPPRPADNDDEEGGGGILVLLFGGGVFAVGGVVVGALLLVILLIAGWVVFGDPGEAVARPTPPDMVDGTDPIDPDDPDTPRDPDDGTAGGDPPDAPRPSPAPGVRPSPTPSPTPGPRPAPGTKPEPGVAPAPSPSPRPAPVRPSPSPQPSRPVTPTPLPELSEGDARVSLSTTGRGSVTCGGATTTFSGPRAFVIEAYQLPATCLVQIEGGRQVFQVYGTGAVTCEKQGGSVQCDKQLVP